jgi:hypothetical protein
MTHKSTPSDKATSPFTSSPGSSLSRKLALLTGGGAAALAGLPHETQAAILPSATLPLTSPHPNSPSDVFVNWDIDGDSTVDFELGGRLYGGSRTYLRSAMMRGNVVLPTSAVDGLSKLSAGFVVGATLASGFKFDNIWNRLTLLSVNFSSFRFINVVASGWSLGETGNFGFQFTNTTGTHYGWGQIAFGGVGDGYTITEAYYNDVAGQPILVGQIVAVPESSYFGLVAMGAAGLAIWRRQRRKAA